MTPLATNVLSCGDNLEILRRYLPDAAVDLVELDPPFNSNRDDNVIFRDGSGSATDDSGGPWVRRRSTLILRDVPVVRQRHGPHQEPETCAVDDEIGEHLRP
jgi:hypothetical protein